MAGADLWGFPGQPIGRWFLAQATDLPAVPRARRMNGVLRMAANPLGAHQPRRHMAGRESFGNGRTETRERRLPRAAIPKRQPPASGRPGRAIATWGVERATASPP